MKRGVRAMILCGLAAASAAPAMGQQFTSPGYEFLKAVKDRDGTKVTDALNRPGNTILTSRDDTGQTALHIVAKRRDPETTPVSDIMTHNPRFISPETTVSDAVLIMKRHNFRHLPIISSTSKILGVFSIRDAMARELVEAESMAELIDQQFTNVLS